MDFCIVFMEQKKQTGPSTELKTGDEEVTPLKLSAQLLRVGLR